MKLSFNYLIVLVILSISARGGWADHTSKLANFEVVKNIKIPKPVSLKSIIPQSDRRKLENKLASSHQEDQEHISSGQHASIKASDYIEPNTDPNDPANKRRIIVYLNGGHYVSSIKNPKSNFNSNATKPSSNIHYETTQNMQIYKLKPVVPKIVHPSEPSYIQHEDSIPSSEDADALEPEPYPEVIITDPEIIEIMDLPPPTIEEPEFDFGYLSSPEVLEVYYRISKNYTIRIKRLENCIDNIEPDNFNESLVNSCLGVNYAKINNYFQYSKKQILSDINDRIELTITAKCYEQAGINTLLAYGCDILIKDVLDLLWAGYNFFDITYDNWKKYTEEYSVMPHAMFSELLSMLKKLQAISGRFHKEVYDHRSGMILALKDYVELRTRNIEATQNLNQKVRKLGIMGSAIEKSRVADNLKPESRIRALNFSNKTVLQVNGKNQASFSTQQKNGTNFVIHTKRYNPLYSRNLSITPLGPLQSTFNLNEKTYK